MYIVYISIFKQILLPTPVIYLVYIYKRTQYLSTKGRRKKNSLSKIPKHVNTSSSNRQVFYIHTRPPNQQPALNMINCMRYTSHSICISMTILTRQTLLLQSYIHWDKIGIPFSLLYRHISIRWLIRVVYRFELCVRREIKLLDDYHSYSAIEKGCQIVITRHLFSKTIFLFYHFFFKFMQVDFFAATADFRQSFSCEDLKWFSNGQQFKTNGWIKISFKPI